MSLHATVPVPMGDIKEEYVVVEEVFWIDIELSSAANKT